MESLAESVRRFVVGLVATSVAAYVENEHGVKISVEKLVEHLNLGPTNVDAVLSASSSSIDTGKSKLTRPPRTRAAKKPPPPTDDEDDGSGCQYVFITGHHVNQRCRAACRPGEEYCVACQGKERVKKILRAKAEQKAKAEQNAKEGKVAEEGSKDQKADVASGPKQPTGTPTGSKKEKAGKAEKKPLEKPVVPMEEETETEAEDGMEVEHYKDEPDLYRCVSNDFVIRMTPKLEPIEIVGVDSGGKLRELNTMERIEANRGSIPIAKWEK